MNQPTHRPVVQAALDDWWLTTDPAHPDLTAAAHQIELYLASSGYRIAPDTRRMPMTQRLAYTLSVTALALGATLASATHWLTLLPFAYVAAFYAHLGHRRRPRTQAQRPTATYDAVTGGLLTDTEPSRIIPIPEPLTEAEYEAIRAKWIKTYGDGRKAHTVVLVDEDDTPICTCTYGQRCPNCRDYTPTPKD